MCFTLNRKRLPKPTVATKDIWVKKTIAKDGGGWLHSLYVDGKPEKWTRGFEYEETGDLFEHDKDCTHIDIEGGCFHSRKKGHEIRPDPDEKIVDMYIPKGALYYENENEYVSNRIVYPKK